MASMNKCLECQTPITPSRRGMPKRFCCTEHAKTFHNRAASRGAAFYHLVRAWRRQRGRANELKLRTEICRLELYYNDIDSGKQTWLPPEMVLDDIARQDMIPSTNLYQKEPAA